MQLLLLDPILTVKFFSIATKGERWRITSLAFPRRSVLQKMGPKVSHFILKENLSDEILLQQNLPQNFRVGLRLMDQPWEKGCGECYQDFGQQVSGAAVHDAAGAKYVCCYGLCGPAKVTADEIL